MSSNSQEKNDSSSSDEEIRRRYESKNISGQKFASEDVDIEISDSDSGQAIATNEKLMNTSSQVIISDYSSDDTLPLLTRTTDDYGSGNEDKPDLCQTIDLSQTQSTQDVLGTDSDSEIPPMLTRENAGIYQKPFTRPKEDASTSFQQQGKLQEDEFPLLKFGPRTEEHKRELSQMSAMIYSNPRRIGPDSGYKKAQRACDRDRYLRSQREKEREKKSERKSETESD